MFEDEKALPIIPIQRKHPLAKCESCPIRENSGFVPTWNPQPKGGIIILGEAPGAHEERKGIPFTGPSGDLLNQILQHHDLKRDDVMLTNSCLCRPKDNADPPKAALDACAERLHAEIAASGADTIVAVGKVAAAQVLNDRGSMRKIRVGPPKPYKNDPRINVIATWHPAYSLRSPDSFPDLVFDFGKIRGKAQDDWVEPDYRVFDNPVSATRALEELRIRFDRVVIDIETGVEKDNSFDHPSEYDLLCVGIAFAKGKAVVIGETALRDDGVRARLRDLLSTAKIIAHNGKFDLAGLRNVCGRQTLWFDTMLASNCLDERPGHHGLKQLSIERLGAPEYEADIRDYVPRGGNYANIPRDILYRYNAYDVVCTWDLYELFSAEMSDADWQKHTFIVQAANALIELELNGIHFDVSYGEKLSQEYTLILNNIENTMNELIGYSINPRSPKQLLEYYATQALELPKTDADLLKELLEVIQGEAHDFTKLLLEHRRKSKLFGTYVKGLAKRVTAEGKVFTTYTLHGTTSGRLASRQPNLQNVVREKSIRNQFVVEHEDNRFIQCLVPGTKILKRDMTWVDIETLLPGDELVGFNKHSFADMEIAVVEGTTTSMQDCYEIITDRGSVISSGNHLWPVGIAPKPTHRKWVRTDQLIGKEATLTLFAEPWEIDRTYEGGYLGGIIDGEATLNLCVNKDTRLSIAQKPGPVLNKIVEYLKLKGFSPSVYGPTGSGVFNVYINGGKKAALKAIGMFRPARFLAKTDQVWTGNRKHTPVKIKEVRYVGKREVVAVKTSTSTLIANGFLSHNCDYKQAEGRVITTLAQDEYLRNIFADPDRDLFSELCNQIFGEGNWAKENRVAMKSIFYGNAYGRGAASIAKELQLQDPPVNITVPEAAQLMREFNALIPNVMKWQSAIKHQVMSGNDLTTPFGRKRSFWLITDKNKTEVLNEALSYMPQSIASDICLRALIRLTPMLRGLATPRLTIHDAIVVETHKDKTEEVIDLMRKEMVQSALEFTDYLPFEVDASIGVRWGDL